MSLVIVGVNQTQTINQSETDQVAFLGAGSLDIAGIPGAPIDVTLSQVAGVGALNIINITDANVTLDGVAGVGALLNVNIGSGGKLLVASAIGIAAGSTVTFIAPNSELAVANGSGLGALSGIAGFAPGSTIDVGALAASVSYADNAGSGTGGTLTLLDGSGQSVATLPLSTGEYMTNEFRLSSDGRGGTLVALGIVVDGVVTTPSTASIGVNGVAMLSVTTSAPVMVMGGAPTLALSDGGVATYDPAASSGQTLVFTHTVAPGQNTPDLAVVGVALNGATVAGSGGVVLDLSGAIGNPAGILQVDTTPPTVTGVTTNPGSGALQPGQSVAISVGTSENVGITGGMPTLALSDGGTATYDPTASTPNTIVFTHTVQPGQDTADLSVLGVDLNGASITDAAGNVANLSGAIMNPPNVLAVAAGSQAAGVLGVFRFFDSGTGTHFFTADAKEKGILIDPNTSGYRADLKQEVNNFGAVDPASGDSAVATVFRFFDSTYGTHFFTASQTEADSLRNTNSPNYRADLVFEPASSFAEHSSQQAGDVAVFRFFDRKYGTHFYTGSQTEAAAIGIPGTTAYRSDLVSEGVGFYAPAGSFS